MLSLFLDSVDDFIQLGQKRVVKDWQRCLEPDNKITASHYLIITAFITLQLDYYGIK